MTVVSLEMSDEPKINTQEPLNEYLYRSATYSIHGIRNKNERAMIDMKS